MGWGGGGGGGGVCAHPGACRLRDKQNLHPASGSRDHLQVPCRYTVYQHLFNPAGI